MPWRKIPIAFDPESERDLEEASVNLKMDYAPTIRRAILILRELQKAWASGYTRVVVMKKNGKTQKELSIRATGDNNVASRRKRDRS